MRTRRVAIAALLAIATLAWTGALFSTWVHRQALNTDNWVSTSSKLLEDPEIRDALGTYLVQQLFAAAPVQQRLQSALPPRLKPLAGPAAAGLREVAQKNAPRLLGTAAALNAWRVTNRAGHVVLLQLLSSDRTANGKVTLDLGNLLKQVAQSIGLSGKNISRLPPNIANLTVFKSDQLKTAQSGFHILDSLPWVMIALTALLLGGAVYLSPDRRRTVLSCGCVLIIGGIAVLALRRVGEHIAVNQLATAPNAQAVADNVWRIATALLVEVAEGSILFGAFVVLGAWLAGAGRRATAVRRHAAPAFREHVAAVYATLAVLLLLLVVWGPVPWTRNPWTMLAVTVIAAAWLEWLRRRTVEEFPDVPSGEWSRGVRDRIALRRLERLSRLKQSGAIDATEFERRKAALPLA